MAVRLSDDEITKLLQETKPLPDDFYSMIQTRPKRGHREREVDVRGVDESEFRLIFRESLLNRLDFSIILAYRPPRSNELFRLIRYNGRSHEHTNAMEGETFYAFHIHRATERYQELGAREDAYAAPTDRYADIQTAVECMLADCSFNVPPQLQGRLL